LHATQDVLIIPADAGIDIGGARGIMLLLRRPSVPSVHDVTWPQKSGS